jgi:hypothetical protein
MSIEKKSLISTLKTAKKANVAASAPEGEVKGSKVASMKFGHKKVSMKQKRAFKKAR